MLIPKPQSTAVPSKTAKDTLDILGKVYILCELINVVEVRPQLLNRFFFSSSLLWATQLRPCYTRQL